MFNNNGIFGNGVGFDTMIFEEWDRDKLIEQILQQSNNYTKDELRFKTITELKRIAE